MIEVSVAPNADSEHRASTSVDAQKKALFSFLAKKPPQKTKSYVPWLRLRITMSGSPLLIGRFSPRPREPKRCW